MDEASMAKMRVTEFGWRISGVHYSILLLYMFEIFYYKILKLKFLSYSVWKMSWEVSPSGFLCVFYFPLPVTHMSLSYFHTGVYSKEFNFAPKEVWPLPLASGR